MNDRDNFSFFLIIKILIYVRHIHQNHLLCLLPQVIPNRLWLNHLPFSCNTPENISSSV